MHQVFMSYSTKDYAQTKAVCDMLEQSGISCWLAPRDIPGGSNYTREIPVAIRNCRLFLLIVSKHAQESHWVLKELDAAVTERKTILPVMLEDIELNDEFRFLLAGTQRYLAFQDQTAPFEQLTLRVRTLVNGTQEPAVQASPANEAPVVHETPSPVQPSVKAESVSSVPSTPSAPETPPAQKAYRDGCPSCGSYDIEELTKRIGFHSFTEKVALGLIIGSAVLCGLAMGGVCWLIFTLLSSMFEISAVARALISLLLILAANGVGAWYCRKAMVGRILRRRAKKHLSEHPYRCRDCENEFLLKKRY